MFFLLKLRFINVWKQGYGEGRNYFNTELKVVKLVIISFIHLKLELTEYEITFSLACHTGKSYLKLAALLHKNKIKMYGKNVTRTFVLVKVFFYRFELVPKTLIELTKQICYICKPNFLFLNVYVIELWLRENFYIHIELFWVKLLCKKVWLKKNMLQLLNRTVQSASIAKANRMSLPYKINDATIPMLF